MSPTRDGSTVKSDRLKKIHKMIIGKGDLELIPLLAWCEYEMGLTRQTARAYLRTLEDLGLIEVDEAANSVREVKPQGEEKKEAEG